MALLDELLSLCSELEGPPWVAELSYLVRVPAYDDGRGKPWQGGVFFKRDVGIIVQLDDGRRALFASEPEAYAWFMEASALWVEVKP